MTDTTPVGAAWAPSASTHTGPQLISGEQPVRFAGGAWARWVLRRLGWRLEHAGFPGRQGLCIVYPHTSNWDFLYGILAKWGTGAPFRFLGKNSLFRVPVMGAWLRWVGGMPVDRSGPHGVVGHLTDTVNAARQADAFFWLALAPEGTRSWRPHWKTGFYHVAVRAQVPLCVAYIDYRRRVVSIAHFLNLSGEPDQDLPAIAAILAGSRGLRPELAAPIEFPPAP